MSNSEAEYAFMALWHKLGNGVELKREYPFAAISIGARDEHGNAKTGLRARMKEFGVHDWRFDFANVPARVAVEIDGGAWTGGRHTRGGGFEDDCDKINYAQSIGWMVFRFTPQMLDRDPVRHMNIIMSALCGRQK